MPENRLDWQKPENYDERWFELALRNVEAGTLCQGDGQLAALVHNTVLNHRTNSLCGVGAGAHHTCRFGQGVVPVRACAQALRRIGYTLPISVEHEPERADPREDVRASAALLRGWMEEPLQHPS